MKEKFIGFYRLCDLLTMTGTVFAVTGIFLSLNGECLAAVFCLIFSGICDAFDGKLASMHKSTKLQKSYGIELDSLSDMVSFGVLPIIIAACTHPCGVLTYIAFIFYAICGLIRLAYYNALAINNPKENDHFIGVPITAVAIFFPIIWLLSYYIEWIQFNFTLFFLILGFLFIIPIKIQKLSIKEKSLLSIIGVIFILLMLFFVCF